MGKNWKQEIEEIAGLWSLDPEEVQALAKLVDVSQRSGSSEGSISWKLVVLAEHMSEWRGRTHDSE